MTVALPQFTDSVDLRYFLEPLQAATHPRNLLDRFPDALYNKAPDSHFVRFMYALLGPVGVGWLKQNLTEARLQLEANGASLFDLESFYGDPFSFGRILTDSFSDDISGLLPAGVWDRIRAQDEAYRARATQFVRAAHLGGTPQGMRLAAASGAGQRVDVVENYQSLFDQHSDDPLGLPYYGKSLTTSEFIVVPSATVSLSDQQAIAFSQATTPLGANSYTVSFNGYTTTPLTAAATAANLQSALQALRSIGPGNVMLTGSSATAFVVTFTGSLASHDVPALTVQFTDPIAGIVSVPVITTTGGVDPSTETTPISDRNRHEIQTALDLLRPVGTLPTYSSGNSTLRPQPYSTVAASTAFTQPVRFVTGSPSIAWPTTDNTHWIEAAVEVEAPQLQTGSRQHYVGWHNISSIQAYTDQALSDPGYLTNSAILANYNSVHVGPFPEMATVMPYFRQFDSDYSVVFGASNALADYAEPLTVSVQTSDGTALINGIYPADYLSLQGTPSLAYTETDFWSSLSRTAGTDILEIDLGSVQAVNYITMEVTGKPVSIAIDYDLIDQAPARTFIPVTFVADFPNDTALFYDPSQVNPWQHLEFYFTDGLAMIFTRFIRILITRRADSTTYGRFLFDTITQTQRPWSIDVRNLRVGRNVAPSVI